MKKCGICFGALVIICFFFSIAGYAKSSESIFYGMPEEEECALCGDKKDSLKSLYGNSRGVGLICLNDWRVVRVLMPEEERNMGGKGISYLRGEENDYSIQIEHVMENKISLVNYSAGKENVPDMKKLSKHLCVKCLKKVKETVTIQGAHRDRVAKAVCLVEFPSMEIYAIQQSFQYYMLDSYYVQSSCEKKNINLTIFMVSPAEVPEYPQGRRLR